MKIYILVVLERELNQNTKIIIEGPIRIGALLSIKKTVTERSNINRKKKNNPKKIPSNIGIKNVSNWD